MTNTWTGTPISPEREALEQDKLRFEISKLAVEHERAALELAVLRRQDEWSLAHTVYARTYPFWGEVSAASVAACISQLGDWSRKWPGEPITIQFNLGGGGVINGLALYDFVSNLRDQGHHVTTVAIGIVASMGGVLLQVGDRRVMGPNSHLLIHEISAGAIGKMSEIEDEVAFMRMMQDRLLDILAVRSTLSKEEIRARWSRKDWWMGAHEAVALGFADEVR